MMFKWKIYLSFVLLSSISLSMAGRKKIGAYCDVSPECQCSLCCLYQAGSRACSPRPGDGQPCDPDSQHVDSPTGAFYLIHCPCKKGFKCVRDLINPAKGTCQKKHHGGQHAHRRRRRRR